MNQRQMDDLMAILKSVIDGLHDLKNGIEILDERVRVLENER
jgi:hypothetical protein